MYLIVDIWANGYDHTHDMYCKKRIYIFNTRLIFIILQHLQMNRIAENMSEYRNIFT